MPRHPRLLRRTALVLAAVVLALPGLAGAETGGRTPPPTPVLVPGGGTSPSPFPQTLHTPPPTLSPPEIAAPSAALADLDSGQVLFAKDADDRRPIASVTKIMTALLVLHRTRPTDVVTVPPDAAAPTRTPGISQLGLLPGERISVQQLLYALLLQSSNDAALALADHVSGSVETFVRAMNAQARRFGMSDTRFYSPNGLDDRGYSTAADLLTLTREAYEHPTFARIVATKTHQIPAPHGDPRVVQNRDVLLWLYPGAIGVKTGFTTAAGYCVVAAAARDGLRLVAVVLGASGEPFSDAATLLDYGFTAFHRVELVAKEEPLGDVEIQGRSVEVASGDALDALVPVDAEVRRRLVVRPGAAFPPPVGESVGGLVVTTSDARVGRVPLIVTSVPGPPPPDPGPWWRRAGATVVHAVSVVVRSLFS